MEFQSLQLDYKDQILVVTINRPEALNAINATVMNDLGELFSNQIQNIEGLRGIILTGAGPKSFVAGADIKEFLELSGSQGRDMSAKGQRIFKVIEHCSVPVVAAINGYALGAGCELAMACHLRIASEKARFGQPEVNLGLVPGYGGTQRLVELIGKTRANYLLMTAEMINAQQALTYGLINEVVEPGQEVERATEILKVISTKAPIAISGVIESVNAFQEKSLDGYAAEVHNFGKCCNTEDFREGASAFVEKRKANFQGK